jgi:hypothetical protein
MAIADYVRHGPVASPLQTSATSTRPPSMATRAASPRGSAVAAMRRSTAPAPVRPSGAGLTRVGLLLADHGERMFAREWPVARLR